MMCFKQEPIKTIEYEMVTLEIWQDDSVIDPRQDFDHLGHMICWHRRYNLGDKHNFADDEDLWRTIAFESVPELEDKINDLEDWASALRWTAKHHFPHVSKIHNKVKEMVIDAVKANAVILPLYLYDHSGITMSTGPFSCPWDSGQVGWIYVTHKEIGKEYGWKKLTKKRLEEIADDLEGEVKEYDMYLQGDIYVYDVKDTGGAILDSCGGFYGYDYILEEAKRTARAWDVDIYCQAQRDRLEDERQDAIDEKRRERKKQVLTELQLAVI